MTPCDIRSLSDIADVASKHFGGDATMWARIKIYHHRDKLFYFDSNLVVYLEYIGSHKYSIHLIGTVLKLREFKNFIIDVGSWMFDNTECTSLLVFVPSKNKVLQMVVGLTGGQRAGIIKDGSGLGEDDIIYNFPISNREKSEERKT